MYPSRVRIGNQTSCHVPGRLPLEFAVRHGFDAFEWFSDKRESGWCEDDTPRVERAALLGVAKDNGILFSVHAPCAADPTTQAGAEAILKSISFGRDVEAGVVNLHLFPEQRARPFAESLGPLLEAARSAGVRLSLENTPQTSPDHCNALFGVLSAMPEAAGRVGMCFDLGHANLFQGTRNDFLRFIDLLGYHVPIIHWHAHENWGDRDSHLPLFTGPSSNDASGLRRIVRRLKERGFSGSVVLEQWPQPPQILVETRRRLWQLMAERRCRSESGRQSLPDGPCGAGLHVSRCERGWCVRRSWWFSLITSSSLAPTGYRAAAGRRPPGRP